MTKLVEKVLSHLSELGFQTRQGSVSPFGELLPLVAGVAWDTRTAQLALLAEGIGDIDPGSWRQLLFAGSAIRHQLADDHPTAFGTPLILAVVDQAGAIGLRELAEEIARNYVVFNRVDLNLIPQGCIDDPRALDGALAPLLPCCRRILGQEISQGEVQSFWKLLREEVSRSAEKLPSAFGPLRQKAGAAGAYALIGDSAETEERPSPEPVTEVSIRNFRSVREADFTLADVNILHGPNGGGKTSVVEALELHWAGTSQRIPEGVGAEEYSDHLPRNGEGDFCLTIDGDQTTTVREKSDAELSRSILAQDSMLTLVNSSPEERFSAMVQITGLEIPDLKSRTKQLVAAAKSRADDALAAADIWRLPRSDSSGLKHLLRELKSNFLQCYSSLPELKPLEEALELISQGAFKGQQEGEDVGNMLADADGLVAEASSDLSAGPEIEATLRAANKAVDRLLTARLERVAATRQLLLEIEGTLPPKEPHVAEEETEEAEEAGAPLDVGLAVKWLTHSRGLSAAAADFREQIEAVEDVDLAGRLREYINALLTASNIAPVSDLERWSQPSSANYSTPTSSVRDSSYLAAGFTQVPPRPDAIVAPLESLADALQEHVEGLRAIVNDLKSHPAQKFGTHASEVMQSLCEFELARMLRREGPIHKSSERLVENLMDERLAPVVSELTAAVTRFEWYFKPLRLSSKGSEIIFTQWRAHDCSSGNPGPSVGHRPSLNRPGNRSHGLK